MKIAVVSDIHGNREALVAVAGEIALRGADRVYHLGDLAGYNAEPEWCIRWAVDNTAGGILGNHDAVACGKSTGKFFNTPALAAARWSAAHISPGSREYLRSLPDRLEVENELLLVHGAPSDPDRYLFTLDDAAEELDSLGGAPGIRVVFFGHTHVPAAVVLREDGSIQSVPPAACRIGEGERALLNPGSVGQPRDRNPDASFLLFDTLSRSASWVRVPYDIAACQAKILAAGLPRLFSTRLPEGT